MKINGKIYVTLEELAKLLGLPGDITIEMTSCNPDDIAGGVFIAHVHKPGYYEVTPLEQAPILHREQEEINRTRVTRCDRVGELMRKFGNE